MKDINLLAHVLSREDVSFEIFEKYSRAECCDAEKVVKESEENDLKELVMGLCKVCGTYDFDLFDHFYYNYNIEQISKEFDLLRFGENYIINIELKRKSTIEKMQKQLLKNYYYLEAITENIHQFTYCSEYNKLYRLNGDSLNLISMDELLQELKNQEVSQIKDISSLFQPSRFLISPFNTPEEFLENKYFLTEHQQNIKQDILKNEDNKFFAIEGKPGTGKTLLLYDVIKEYADEYFFSEMCIVHCGKLNEGHSHLIAKEYPIIAAKYLISYLKTNCPKIIFVDESQRIYKNQFEKICNYVNVNENVKCIFSFDREQTLSPEEIKNNIPDMILSLTSVKHYRLTDKIRTNKEMASFITSLFDLSKTNPSIIYRNVSVSHFNDYKKANIYLLYLKRKGYVCINYTPSQYYDNPFQEIKCTRMTSHSVIGQEYDKVAAFLDDSFFYKNKRLRSRGYSGVPYSFIKMFYQAVTRVRNELNIIVINNEEVFHECLKIINKEEK